MNKLVNAISVPVIVLLVVSVFPTQDAKAYIDPGSGSLMLQYLSSGILLALVSLKTFFKSICARK